MNPDDKCICGHTRRQHHSCFNSDCVGDHCSNCSCKTFTLDKSNICPYCNSEMEVIKRCTDQMCNVR